MKYALQDAIQNILQQRIAYAIMGKEMGKKRIGSSLLTNNLECGTLPIQVVRATISRVYQFLIKRVIRIQVIEKYEFPIEVQ